MGGRDRWGGGGARVSEFFFHKEFKSKNFFFFFGGGGGVRGRVGGGRWMDNRKGPNHFAPSTSSKLGA